MLRSTPAPGFCGTSSGFRTQQNGVRFVLSSPHDRSPGEADSAQHRGCPLEDGSVWLCQVCASVCSGEGHFLLHISDRHESIVATMESIVDALGFCDYHGSLLTGTYGKRTAMARALRAATDRVISWLSDERHYADRLFGLFFAVEQTCVGCKLHDQRLARVVHQASDHRYNESKAPTFCFPHYRELTYAAKAPSLPALADAQLRLLRRISNAVGPPCTEEASAGAPRPVAGPTLQWALRVVAGEAAAWIDRFGGNVEDRQSDADVSCSVCAAIREAEEDWVDTVKVVARVGKDLWTALPTCPGHIAFCARRGDHDIALLAVRYATWVQMEALQAGVVELAHDEASREAAKQSVFYRRKSPAWILGRQRKMITKIPRCPACERMFVAQERAVGDLVSKLGDAPRRNATGLLSNLCLKHFASVYAFVWKSDMRATLVSAQIDKLRRLSGRLSEAIDAGTGGAIDEGIAEAMHVWQTALARPPGPG